MPRFTPEEIARIGRLARLALSPSEAQVLATQLEAITDSFGDLTRFAEDLPPAPPVATGAPRADGADPFPDAEAIRDGFPRREGDHARAPRGRA